MVPPDLPTRPGPSRPAVSSSARPVAGARGSTMAAALVLAGLTGVRDALEETRPEIFEVRPDLGLDGDDPVTVLFVPDAPAATVAVVRPWRFPSHR